MNLDFKLTRFAPTPSGFLHLGNVFSFIFTYHFAKTHHAKILLRIDDLDRERVKKRFIQDIFDTLDFLEIPFDLGPTSLKDFKQNYAQIHRIPLYRAALAQLQHTGNLFACDCSRRKVAKMHPGGFYTGFCRTRNLTFDSPSVCWRMQTPVNLPIPIKDVKDGPISGKIPGILTDVVLQKKDGFPAYQLTSVVDDLHYGVDLIIRGRDLWGSSLVQNYLSGFLQPNAFNQNTFYHHPLITGSDNKKLSKSSGATSIQFLRKSGKKKSEIYQLLGEMVGIKSTVANLQDFVSYLSQKDPEVTG